MILMEFLLAPTVPSPPRPQNLQEMVPAGVGVGHVFRICQRQIGHVVGDADGEALRFVSWLSMLANTAKILRWGGVLAAQAIAAATAQAM